MDGLRNTVPDLSSSAGSQFHYLASSLARLLETARRELERDREAAKASLATASTILQSEIERHLGAHGSKPGALAGWQITRVRAFIERNFWTARSTPGISVLSRSEARRTSRVRSNRPSENRRMLTW